MGNIHIAQVCNKTPTLSPRTISIYSYASRDKKNTLISTFVLEVRSCMLVIGSQMLDRVSTPDNI